MSTLIGHFHTNLQCGCVQVNDSRRKAISASAGHLQTNSMTASLNPLSPEVHYKVYVSCAPLSQTHEMLTGAAAGGFELVTMNVAVPSSFVSVTP